MIFDEPPKTIWLQYHGDAEPDDAPVPDDGITWCWDQIYEHDVKYVRADIAEQRVLIAEQRVLSAREECAKICEDYAKYHANEGESAKAESWLILQCAAKIRETIK